MVLLALPLEGLSAQANHSALVAQYLFDGNADDTSGNQNHGIVHGANLTTDRHGNPNAAYAFNGSAYIEIPNSTRLNLSSSFTLSVWIRNDFPTAPSIILSKHDSGADTGYLLSHWSNRYLVQFGNGCGGWPYSGNAQSSGQILESEWKHVVVTRSGSEVSFYMDGILDSVAQSGMDNISASNSKNLWIGADVGTGSLSFNTFIGDLDEIRLFDRALLPDQVLDLTIGILPQIEPITPVCSLPFNGNAQDESGFGNHGIVHGATLVPDRFGNPDSAYWFDGSDYIAVPDSPSLRLSSEYTISVWVKNQQPNVPSIVLSKLDEGGDSGYLVSNWSDRYMTQFGDGCGGWPYSGDVFSNSNVVGDQWTRLLVSRSGPVVSFFINGMLDSTIAVGSGNIASSNGVDLWIGADVNTGVLSFNTFVGSIDDLKIFDRSLSPADLEGSAPVAAAGSDQSVHAGQLVTLDGSASYDMDENYPLEYQWTLLDMPVGSFVELSGQTTPQVSFTPDGLGDYVLGLVVIDALGLTSLTDEVTVSTFNAGPVADAGPDQTVTLQGSLIQLSGMASWDPEGDDLSFFWELTHQPPGSQMSLSGATSVSPTFVADEYGAYVVRLTVSDSWVTSTSDEVVVSFLNLPPVADAGSTQHGVVGQSFLLDGGGSTDPNEDPLAYSWSIASSPLGSEVNLSSEVTPTTSLIADLPGTYIFSLVVSDGHLSSPASNVTITVVSLEDTLMLTLSALMDAINVTPESHFKNRNQRGVLARKVGTVMSMVEAGYLADARNKLANDVLQKTDGCQSTGQPDKNDWVRDCSSQGSLTPHITASLQVLDSMQ